jgi:hypothetical protein
MGMWPGFEMQTWALLIRVPASPEADGLAMQRQYPRVMETGSLEQIFNNDGEAVATKFVFTALEDPNASSDAERFGTWVVQTAPALP